MKYFDKTLSLVQQCDLFSSNIALRYKTNNDYKTVTSALVSLAMIIFFAYVGFNSFVSMINYTDITFNTQTNEDLDPTEYDMGTSDFMFAVALNGINMNLGPRYFNLAAQQTYSVNGVKTNYQITLQPCSIAQWTKFGDQITEMYTKLNFDQWLCPAPNTSIVIRGKYTSQFFDYVKISVTNCSGIVNGQGCLPSSSVASYQTANDTFGFNFYFVNTIINPGNLQATSFFLDDSNNFQFSSSIGTLCNFYLQSYQIATDVSLIPVSDIQSETGATVTTQTFSSVYSVNLNETSSQFLKFYIRKSPLSLQISRSFFRFDELLSYIGGLFGLIAILVQMPLGSYNSRCFELNLATDLFHYKQKEQSEKEKEIEKEKEKKQSRENEKSEELQKGGLKTQNFQLGEKPIIQNQFTSSTINKHSQNPDVDAHSIDRFNFLWHLLLSLYIWFKKLGWKSLYLKKIDPFYKALNEIGKQIDVGGILHQFRYVDKLSNVLLDEPQIKLLHLSTRQSILDLSKARSHYKIRKKLTQHLPANTHSNEDQKAKQNKYPQEIDQCYFIVKKRRDKVSKKILQILDPQIALVIQTSKDNEFQIVKNLDEESERKGHHQNKEMITHQNLNNQINLTNEQVMIKPNEKSQKLFYFIDEDKFSQYTPDNL